jgi:hypothetical protein
MSIRADPFVVMDRKEYLKEHQHLDKVLEGAKTAAASAERKKQEAEVHKAMKMPKARMEVIERPAKMKHHAEGAPLMHSEY